MVLYPGPIPKSKKDDVYGQCLRVDWKKYDGGKWIAGGFVSGFVALWKVEEFSKLLVLNESTGDW